MSIDYNMEHMRRKIYTDIYAEAYKKGVEYPHVEAKKAVLDFDEGYPTIRQNKGKVNAST